MGRHYLVDNPKGLPIRDAKRDVLIRVKATDIRGAKRKSPTGCAFARAACHERGVIEATVNKAVTYLKYRDRIERYMTPQSAVRELVAFDRNAPFAEGEYWFKAPPASSRLRGRIKKGRGPHKTKRIRGRHVTIMVRGA